MSDTDTLKNTSNLQKKMNSFALKIENGDIIDLMSGSKPEIIDKAPSGKIYLDGKIAVNMDSQSIKERKNLSLNGYLEITLIVGNSGKIKKPIISFKGIPEKEIEESFIFEMEDQIHNTCRTFSINNKKQRKKSYRNIETRL